jgi:hypothetical protein
MNAVSNAASAAAKKLMKSLRIPVKLPQETSVLYSTYAIFGAAALYILYCGQLATLGLAIGVAMIVYAVSGLMHVALLGGAIVGLLALPCRRAEGFEDADADAAAAAEGAAEGAEDAAEGAEDAAVAAEDAAEGFEEEMDAEDEEDAELIEEGFANVPKPRRRAKKPLPDNRDRREFLELGKKYKMPREEDDGDYHLDAGTTFLNAYKSLKPDQIAAMTKDTQELMETQRQLMSTLNTLKPLIQDGKEMMNTFQSYFGSGTPSAN